MRNPYNNPNKLEKETKTNDRNNREKSAMFLRSQLLHKAYTFKIGAIKGFIELNIALESNC